MTDDHEAQSDEPTTQDVDALADVIARMYGNPTDPDDHLPDHCRAMAEAITDSDWYAEHDAQIRDLLEEREELLTEIRRLRMGHHPAGRALRAVESDDWHALRDSLTERDAEHEGGEGA